MRLLILVLILIKKSDQGVPWYAGYPEQAEVLSCVNRIVKRHFDSEHQVAILSQGSKDYVNGIESAVRTVVTTTEPDKTPWFTETKQAIVFLDGDFHRNVKILMSLGTFHSRSRFMIVCTTGQSVSSQKNYLMKLVNHLHQNRRWMVVMAVKSIDDEDVHLYGYTKTAYDKCDRPDIIDFGYCSESNVDRLFSNTILNYNQCPLRLATYDWPPLSQFIIENGQRKRTIGIESHIVQCIVERLNASALLLDEAPSKIRKTVTEYNVDIGYGQLAVYGGDQFSYTSCYGVVKGSILVPKYSSARYRALNNLMPFEMTVWIALILVVTFIIILRILLPDLKAISMLSILSLFLGFSVPTKLRRLSLRLYFLTLVWFGYIMTQAYVANLMMIFTKANDYDVINSLDELDKSKIRIGGVPWVATNFLKEKYPRLYAEFMVMDLNKFKQNLEELRIGHGGFAMYLEVSRFSHYNYWKHTTIVPEVITTYPVAMLVPNTSTILSTCDNLITAILEAGLMDHWAVPWTVKYEKEATITDGADNERGSMGLQQFLVIFQLLGSGLGFCTVVFIGELLIRRH